MCDFEKLGNVIKSVESLTSSRGIEAVRTWLASKGQDIIWRAKYSAIRRLLTGALACLDSFVRSGGKGREMAQPSQSSVSFFHVILINVPAAWPQPIGCAHLEPEKARESSH